VHFLPILFLFYSWFFICSKIFYILFFSEFAANIIFALNSPFQAFPKMSVIKSFVVKMKTIKSFCCRLINK